MKTVPILGSAAVLVLAVGCAPSSSPAPKTITKTIPIAPVRVGQGMFASQSIYNGMPEDPQLIFEHRRNVRSIPSRPLRQLTAEEADGWIGELKSMNTSHFNLMPEFAPHGDLRQAAVASMEELREMIVSPDADIQRVSISEAILRKNSDAVFALDKVQSSKAVHAMWRFRGFEDGQSILASWKDSPSEERRQAAYLYLGTEGDPDVKADLIKMADEEMRNVIPRSGKGNRRPELGVAGWPASARHILAKHYFSEDAAALAKYRLEPKFLLTLGTPAGLKVIHDAFKSDDFYRRKDVMVALGESEPHEGRNDTLIRGLSDPEAQVRVEAAKALAKVGDKSVLPAMLKAYQNPPPPKPGTGMHQTALAEIAKAIEALGGTVPQK